MLNYYSVSRPITMRAGGGWRMLTDKCIYIYDHTIFEGSVLPMAVNKWSRPKTRNEPNEEQTNLEFVVWGVCRLQSWRSLWIQYRQFKKVQWISYFRIPAMFWSRMQVKNKARFDQYKPNTLGGPLSHHHHKLYQQENCSWATRLHSDTKDPFRSSNHSSPSDDSAGKLSRRNHIASQHWPSPKQHSVVANDIAFAKQTVWMFTGSKMYNTPANIYIYIHHT